MNTSEQTRQLTIRELINTPGPCITLALAGNEARDLAIELKDAIGAVRKQLQTRGIDPEELLKPIAALGAEFSATRPRGHLVILRSPAVMQVHRVRWIKPVVRVDERFDVRIVLAVAAAQKLFYVLALSQNRTRILKCTQDGSEEIPFPAGFPASLADAMQTRQPDHTLDNRASGGPSIGGGKVVFGTSSDHDDKGKHLHDFFARLDKAVHSVAKDSTIPLIVVGVEPEIALYRRVNTYPGLVEPGIHGAPDGLDVNEIHSRALELLEQREAQPGREVPADFDKRVGTGHASTQIQEIVAAAYEGRVSHLFLQPNSQYPGTYDPVRRRISHIDDPRDSAVDLIEMAAYQTILHGGEAKILAGSAMPNGVPVCALFRYPAAQNTMEAEPVETMT